MFGTSIFILLGQEVIIIVVQNVGRPSYIVPVTSGLASKLFFVLLVSAHLLSSPSVCPSVAMIPTYCASKAALHSYGKSLSAQLADTRVKVMEIMPP
jgi:short-subunit dehydrogenase involved in D-alanine esterification of teichoic acids